MTMNNLALALNSEGQVCKSPGAVVIDKTIVVSGMKVFMKRSNTVMFVLVLVANRHNSIKT